MKNYLLAIGLISFSALKLIAQNNVGIGTTTPNTNAILDLQASNKGFLAPRLSTAQMNAIVTTPSESALLIYNTDSACYHFYNGAVWKNLCTAKSTGIDTALINNAIKNYLANNPTTVINILKGDTALFNYTTINQANINILNVDTSITNVAIINNANINILNVDTSITNVAIINNANINILTADTSILNYANINNAIIDSLQANYITSNIGNFNTLNVGGQNIMNTISDSISAQAWLLKGNSGTNPNTNFIGTTDNKSFRIRTNNTEKMIIDSMGLVGIGTSTPTSPFIVEENLTATPSWGSASIAINRYGAAHVGVRTFMSNGTKLAPTNVLTNDGIGSYAAGAYYTGKPQNYFVGGDIRAGIAFLAAEDWIDASHNGTYMTLSTTQNATGFAVERMRIDHNGNVGIGTATPIDKLHLKGFDGRDIVFSPGSLTPTINFMHNDNGNVNARWAYIAGSLQNGGTGFNYGHLTFGTAPNIAGNPAAIDRMHIDGEGNTTINASTYFVGDVFSVRANNYGSATSNTVGDYAINGYSSAGTGVYGEDNSNGNGVSGISLNGIGVNGTSTNFSGVFGRSSAPLSAGVFARNSNPTGTGSIGRGNYTAGDVTLISLDGSGGAFSGDNIGVVGYAINSTKGLTAGTTSAGGYFADTISTLNKTYAWTATYNSGTKYKILGDGAVSTIIKDKTDKEYIMYCTESPEVLFDDYGKGQLVNGEATIQLDELFSHNIIVNDKHELRVFIQLEGDCNGVFVTDKSSSSFKVKELNKGTANVKFSYHVIGNRKDEKINDQVVSKYQDNRFVPAVGLHLQSIDISKTIKENTKISKTIKPQ